jgi:nicotinate-nucleotide--dimethylbenzimidazole phosphoribosyltransferase
MENRNILDHCLIGHCSKEPGHKLLLEKLDCYPILNLDMALGEGSGSALSVQILRAALKCHSEMATFQEAGVTGKS